MTSDEKKKTTPKKSASKLGHDPLAWIDDVNAGMAPEAESMPAPESQGAKRNVATSAPTRVMETAMPENTATLNLPVYFGIAQSAEICAEMQKIMASGGKEIKIAGGDVESFDTAAVQLMMALNKAADLNDIEISWSGCSQKMTEVRQLLNIKI